MLVQLIIICLVFVVFSILVIPVYSQVIAQKLHKAFFYTLQVTLFCLLTALSLLFLFNFYIIFFILGPLLLILHILLWVITIKAFNRCHHLIMLSELKPEAKKHQIYVVVCSLLLLVSSCVMYYWMSFSF